VAADGAYVTDAKLAELNVLLAMVSQFAGSVMLDGLGWVAVRPATVGAGVWETATLALLANC
jgi:hypothetical protein